MIAQLRDLQFALFVDYENVADAAGIQLEQIIKEVSAEGTIALLRAYADWSRFGNHRKRLQAGGFELIDLPGSNGKNRADIKLAVDVMQTVFEKTFIDSFIIVSGDSDFVPLVTKLNELNRRSWLYTPKAVHSPLLAQYCYRLGSCNAKPKVKSVEKRSPQPSARPKNEPKKTPKQSPKATSITPPTTETTSTASSPKPKIPDALCTQVYWVLRAMDNARSGPHRLQHMMANLRSIEPNLDLRALLNSTTRCSIRFAEQLQKQGVLRVEFLAATNCHHLTLNPEYEQQGTMADAPAWVESLSKAHAQRFIRPPLVATVPNTGVMKAGTPKSTSSSLAVPATVNQPQKSNGPRQLSLFDQ